MSASPPASVRLTPALETMYNDGGDLGVRLIGLDRSLTQEFEKAGRLTERLLRVRLDMPAEQTVGNLPDMAGRYELVSDDLQFLPLFPFEPGLRYRASSGDATAKQGAGSSIELTFSPPAKGSGPPPEVVAIYPSADELPENLLRFHVCFSRPMRRGDAQAAVALVGPDGVPVEDALYRAPVELWDPSMRRLTVLLDPGRLKRGVGPNRELGPPLRTGDTCSLVIGAELTDENGQALARAAVKRFRVCGPERLALDIGQWSLELPARGSREALSVDFRKPLDQALTARGFEVVGDSGPLTGQVAIDRDETRWSFVPERPWSAGPHRIVVAATLEDVCGDDTSGPFDRPLRADGQSADVPRACDLPFSL